MLRATICVALVAGCSSEITEPRRGDVATGGDLATGDSLPGDPTSGDPSTGDPGTGDTGIDCSTFTYDESLRVPMPDHDPPTRNSELTAWARLPTNPACALPTLVIQTPYDRRLARQSYFPDACDAQCQSCPAIGQWCGSCLKSMCQNPSALPNPLFESPHYAVVIVDWRGFGESTATIYNGSPTAAEDGHATIEWVAAQSWSNGRIGTWGASALCRRQYDTAASAIPPPHLEAAVPIFCPPNESYSMWYPGGVLRDEYAAGLSVAGYGAAPLANALLVPYFSDLIWGAIEADYEPANIQIPMLNIAGWWDLYNPGNITEGFVPVSGSASQRLLVGPWFHFATSGEGFIAPFDAQERRFIDPTRDIQQASLAFFDFHLRDDAGSAAATWSAVQFARQDAGQFESAASWPPPGVSPNRYYLHGDGVMRTTVPSAGVELSYSYDPDDPSPSIGGAMLYPTLAAGPSTVWPDLKHGPRNQAEVLAHGEGQVWRSEPLATELRIAGGLTVELSVKTDALDTDFAVRITDVDASGDHLLIGEGIHRLKLRNGFRAADIALATSGQAYDVEVPVINELAHTFAAGHRIGLIVTSSNYPRFARNPNSGDDAYPESYYLSALCPLGRSLCGVTQGNRYDQIESVTPQAATNTIVMGSSALVLPVQ